MKYCKEILMQLALILIISGCGLKTKKQIDSNYQINFCSWAVPFYSLKEPFEENVSNEMIGIMYRYDIEYDCVCNHNQVSCNQKQN